MTRPAPVRVAAFAAILAASASAGACGYDWAVRDAPVRADAAVDGDDGEAGASSDAAVDGGHDVGVSADAAADARESCALLARALADARDAGQSCTLGATPAPCQTKLIDECGCSRYLGQAGSPAAKQYEAAIAQFKASGCTPDCTFCSGTTGACLLSPAHCNP